MNRKKVFDPRDFYRKLENHFKKNPIFEDNPSSITPIIGFLYGFFKGHFRIENAYLFEKKENRYYNLYSLFPQKNDFVAQSYDAAEIIRGIDSKKESLNVFRNFSPESSLNDSIDLYFMVFGTDQRYMIGLKTDTAEQKQDQLYYLLSSFKYLLNQHLKF